MPSGADNGRPLRLALLNDGTTVPVTGLYDANGDETDDPDEAVTFVATDGERWLEGHCADFDEITTH